MRVMFFHGDNHSLKKELFIRKVWTDLKSSVGESDPYDVGGSSCLTALGTESLISFFDGKIVKMPYCWKA